MMFTTVDAGPTILPNQLRGTTYFWFPLRLD
jgi:hypothetical protein